MILVPLQVEWPAGSKHYHGIANLSGSSCFTSAVLEYQDIDVSPASNNTWRYNDRVGAMLPTHRRCGIVVHPRTITTLVSSTLAPISACRVIVVLVEVKDVLLLYAIWGAEAFFEPHKDKELHCVGFVICDWRDNHVRAVRLIPGDDCLGLLHAYRLLFRHLLRRVAMLGVQILRCPFNQKVSK